MEVRNQTLCSQLGCDGSCVGCEELSKQPISLAMAYVPMQRWQEIYEPDVALERGTIFAQLDLPFLGKEGLPR